jgi:hypothetical protein
LTKNILVHDAQSFLITHTHSTQLQPIEHPGGIAGFD